MQSAMFPKQMRRLSVPKSAIESQNKKQQEEMDIFDIEIDYEDVDIQIPQEELEEVFGSIPDFEEKEEE